MAFSNTILPAVAPVGQGGPLVNSMSGINALRGQNADIALKNAQAYWMPFQYKMQALSNPMLWMAAKDNPALQSQLMGMLSNPMSGIGGQGPMGGGGGGVGPMMLNSLLSKMGMGGGSPGGGGGMVNSLLGLPLGASGGPFGPGANSAPAGNTAAPGQAQATGTQANPLVPSTGGGASGAIGSMTAPMTQSPYTPGTQIPDPNNPGGTISVPSGETVASAQRSINAIQRVTPIIQRIATEAAPFQTAQGMAQLNEQRMGNFFMGHNNPAPTQYAKLHSDLAAAPEALLKAYGLNPTDSTIQRMESVIAPTFGENGNQYQARVLNTLHQIQSEQQGVNQQTLSRGYALPANDSQPATQNAAPQQNSSGGYNPLSILNQNYDPGDAGRKQFQSNFNQLNSAGQKAVLAELQRRKKAS